MNHYSSGLLWFYCTDLQTGGKKIKCTLREYRTDENINWFELNAVPIENNENENVLYLTFINNITEKKNYEDSLNELKTIKEREKVVKGCV